jgi:DNA topoisomerase-1
LKKKPLLIEHWLIRGEKSMLTGRRDSIGSPISIWSLKGRVLVIAEKPKAAKRIAEALSSNYVTKRFSNISYYEIQGRHNTIIVASAVGHLYELHTDESNYPVFTYKWVPAYLVNREKRYVKEYIELLGSIAKKCNYYVNACDYDIEGSVIGYLIIKFHGDESKAFRAKFSSLTPQELRESFNNLLPLDYPMIEAGLCRHELDWLWGINVSRALMHSINAVTKKKIILSAGRVQTPTLTYIYNYELKRGLHIPLPQYHIAVVLSKSDEQFRAEYLGNPVESMKLAAAIEQEIKKHKELVVKSVEVSKSKLNPPPPFNLSDLQEEASRIYGFSPIKTQEIAEQLYLEALISYPRTNSQKLPRTLDYKMIITKLAAIDRYRGLVSRLLSETRGVLEPVEGEKEDPAHPAIYPTGVIPGELTRDQWAIYDLVVRRFLATFAPPAIISHIKVVLSTPDGKHLFSASGLVIDYPGWTAYYSFHTPSSVRLPLLTRGERLKVIKVSIRETYTKPSTPLKKIDILRWMEAVGIGTESTRAVIIEKLFDRKYLKSVRGKVAITSLGIGIVEVVSRFFPGLTSVELTRKFELLMEDVMQSRRKRREVIDEAQRVLLRLLERFNENLGAVGESLAKRLMLVENSKKCLIDTCTLDAYAKGLCKIHYEALESLYKTYEQWRERKEVTFDQYINKLAKMKSTGRFVKEVIKYYLFKSKTPATR